MMHAPTVLDDTNRIDGNVNVEFFSSLNGEIGNINANMIPVTANEFAFSIHVVLLTAITLFQIIIYDVCPSIIFMDSHLCLVC